METLPTPRSGDVEEKETHLFTLILPFPFPPPGLETEKFTLASGFR